MDSSRPRAQFQSTHWSLISVARDSQSPDAKQALESLCEGYWQPLYAYLRRSGKPKQDAEDLTQGFFEQLLEKNYLDDADQSRGKFRTFLLASLKNFVSKQQEKGRAIKRGGGQTVLSLDFESAERTYQMAPADHWTADALFERQWALTLLDRVLRQLEEDYAADGKQRLFEFLKPTLTGGKPARSYSELAADLETTTGALKVAAHRLRKTYRQALCDEISQTLSDDQSVDSERDVLLSSLLGGK